MNITVYCGSTSGSEEVFTQKAKQLGYWMAEKDHTLVFGGSHTGMMGAISNAVLEKGGKVIGVVPNVAAIQARTHTSLTQIIHTETMAERKDKMIELGEAFIAMPGGIGTLDEITEVISLSSLGIIHAPILFYDVNGYYTGMKEMLEHIISHEFGKQEYFENILFSEDIDIIENFLHDFK